MKETTKLKFMKELAFLLLLSQFFQSSLTHKLAFEGKPLEIHATAEQAGFDQAKLETLSHYIDRNSATTDQVVLHKGKQVYSYGNLEKVSYIASCHKSVLSMLYGKYVDDGSIDLSTTLCEQGIAHRTKPGLFKLLRITKDEDAHYWDIAYKIAEAVN